MKLKPLFSKCGQLQQHNIAWELIRNANYWALSKTY